MEFSDFIKRHAEKIDFSKSGCWLWTGCTAGAMNYGNVWCGETQKMVRAHRLSYESMFGKIPDNLVACHECDNPKCVNPHHIFLGTQSDNIRDMHKKGRSRHSNLGASKAASPLFSEAV